MCGTDPSSVPHTSLIPREHPKTSRIRQNPPFPVTAGKFVAQLKRSSQSHFRLASLPPKASPSARGRVGARAARPAERHTFSSSLREAP